MTAKHFKPDWISPTGETVLDLIEERSLSRGDFAKLLTESEEFVDRLITGEIEVTGEIAVALAKVLGASAEFWNSRELYFRAELARLESSLDVTDWLHRLPWKEMVKFGWLTLDNVSPDEVEKACLNFFGVPDFATWRLRYSQATTLAGFRKSPRYLAKVESVAAWLRQGEIVAAQSPCGVWNPEAFQNSLLEIRRLSRLSAPEKFLPKLIALAARCGVCVAIVRSPSGCPVSGAARFISPNLALIQLSFRYLADDHFWFTLFHEAGHLLLHRHTMCHLEGVEALSEKEETEANNFASDLLIPPNARRHLRDLPVDAREVIRYAARIEIAPGIVVGQMQHAGLITRRQLNGLKRRYRWSD